MQAQRSCISCVFCLVFGVWNLAFVFGICPFTGLLATHLNFEFAASDLGFNPYCSYSMSL